MSEEHKMGLSIWFLCGIILSVYGITITASGIYNVYNPPDVVAASLHLDLIWGLVLLAAGIAFLVLQRPSRVNARRLLEPPER